MFIILESLSEIDPRFCAEIEYLEQYKHWEFEVAYIAPTNVASVQLSKIAHREVSETVARACKFASADHNNRLGIVEGSEIHDELIHASMEPHSYKPKVYYTLTADDLAATLEFLKAEMHIALEKHYRDNLTEQERLSNTSYRAALEAEIDACDNVNSAKKLIHTRFGTGVSPTLARDNNWGPAKIQLSQ